MVFGVILLVASWGIIRDSLSILMEGAPKGVDLNEVVNTLNGLPGVLDVHHVHAWTLTSNKDIFSAHIRIDRPDRAEVVLKEAHRLLRDHFGFFFSTIQTEETCLDEDHAKTIDISAHLRSSAPAEGTARGT
jgi:cobalt-zinc-cadmium efflux system protein